LPIYNEQKLADRNATSKVYYGRQRRGVTKEVFKKFYRLEVRTLWCIMTCDLWNIPWSYFFYVTASVPLLWRVLIWTGHHP